VKKFSIHKEAVIVPVLLTGIIWIIFFMQSFMGLKECYGIIPLSFKGLRGIFLAPFFHGNWQHIVSNTVPLFVLTFLTFQFYEKLAYFVLVNGWIASGFVVWMLPDFAFMNSSVLSCHIGASGIIYVLAFFLFFSGVFRKEKTLMAVALVVVFLYGGIIWGMFPREIFGIQDDGRISWESHLSGGVTGFILAFMLRKIGRQKDKAQWEKKEYDTSADEELWERYKKEYPEYFYDEKAVDDEMKGLRKKINYIYEYKGKEKDSSGTEGDL
jgi:membrane associated rhomboid family serine protease